MRNDVVSGLVASLLLAVSCQSAGPPSPAPRTAAVAAARTFDCDGRFGFVLAQVDGPSEAVDLVLRDRRERLPRVPTASGARYASGGISLWSKGREAVLDLNGQVAMCREAAVPGDALR